MKLALPLLSPSGTTTGFLISPEVVESFNKGKRVPVLVTINGHSWRNSIAVYNGEFWLGVGAENRAAAGISAGDVVDLEIELDDKPRTMEIPDDLQAALSAEPGTLEQFKALSFSKQRGMIDPINQAKTPETRQRRIEKAVAALQTEKG